MFYINKLKLSIVAREKQATEEKAEVGQFGFYFEFSKGLNIIKGENTVGKSTVIACIYYALGLEHLLGTGGLDKALHSEFFVNGIRYNQVHTSTIDIEIENRKGNIYTLKRKIKGSDDNIIRVAYGRFEDDLLHDAPIHLFVNSKSNEVDSRLSLQHWFSEELLGIPFPIISTADTERKDGILSFKSIFLASFINQINGWADFLGLFNDINKKFNIKDVKERVIEFLLNLAGLQNAIDKDRIENEIKKLKTEWGKIRFRLDLLTDYNRAQRLLESSDVEKSLRDSNSIAELSFKIRKDLTKVAYISISDYKNELQEKVNKIEIEPKFASEENNKELKPLLREKMKELQKYRADYEVFLTELELEREQLHSYSKHLKNIQLEITTNENVETLKKEYNIDVSKNCPTCRQEIKLQDIKERIKIEALAITANIEYLKNQKELLQSSVDSLKRVITQKESIHSHFGKEISYLENEIKHIQSELCDPTLMPSRTQMYERVILENKINELTKLNDTFEELKGELLNLSQRFNNYNIELEGIQELMDSDKDILERFGKDFKELLFKFGYSSNSKNQISIQLNDRNKYFPCIRLSESSRTQKIQVSSSASDFIRSIWAYTIALLINSKNHPGILLFDEPGQHAMKSESLSAFFRELSTFKDKQIIVAASTEPKEAKDIEEKTQYSLEYILKGIEHHSIVIKSKAIGYMNY